MEMRDYKVDFSYTAMDKPIKSGDIIHADCALEAVKGAYHLFGDVEDFCITSVCADLYGNWVPDESWKSDDHAHFIVVFSYTAASGPVSERCAVYAKNEAEARAEVVFYYGLLTDFRILSIEVQQAGGTADKAS